MRKLIFIYLSLLSLNGMTQTSNTISIEGSYQFYNKQSICLGVSISKQLKWPDWSTDLFSFSSLHVEKYIGDPNIKDIYAVGVSAYIGMKYIYLGANTRYVFEGKSHRGDIGPAIRIGYKFVWLEYSVTFLGFDNQFSDNPQLQKVNLDKVEYNIRLVVTIPIFKE